MAHFKKMLLVPVGAALLAVTPVIAEEMSDYPTYGPQQERVVNGVRIPHPKANEHQRHVGKSFELWAYLQAQDQADADIGKGTTGPSYIDDAPEGAPVPLPKTRKRILDGAS